MLKLVAAMLGVLPALAAVADTCPWLDAKVAAEVILVKPTEITLQKNPVTANPEGMVASTTCRFKDAKELVGQLAVIVMEFKSDAGAKAVYDREFKGQGSRARPTKIGASPAFFTQNPGFSGATYAAKGNKLLFVTHVFSKRVNEAIASNPDAEVLSTTEIARQVLGKL